MLQTILSGAVANMATLSNVQWIIVIGWFIITCIVATSVTMPSSRRNARASMAQARAEGIVHGVCDNSASFSSNVLSWLLVVVSLSVLVLCLYAGILI